MWIDMFNRLPKSKGKADGWVACKGMDGATCPPVQMRHNSKYKCGNLAPKIGTVYFSKGAIFWSVEFKGGPLFG